MNRIRALAVGLLLVGLLAACSSTVTAKHATTAASTSAKPAASTPPVNISTETGVGNPMTFPPVTPPKPKAPAAPEYTLAQEQARLSAMDYLAMDSGFSRAGLIGQLSSSAGEGFKKADATFAVNSLKVDWNKQAVLSAKGYLAMGGFSRSSLIDQLTSQYGEQFTLAQATYAANHVGF